MKVILFAGQSLGGALFTTSPPGGPPTPHPDTHMWNGSGWVAPTGYGAVSYCNMLREAFGEPVYVINANVGGSTLLANCGVPCWLGANGLVNSAIATTQAALATLPGACLDRIEWWQGQSDSLNPVYPDMFASYKAALLDLLAAFRSAFGGGFRFCIVPTCRGNSGSIHGVLWAQLNVADTTANCEPGPACYDLTYTDGIHIDVYGYVMMGLRLARNAISYFIAKANAADTIPHYGSGPRIIKINRYLPSPIGALLVDVGVKPGFYLSPRLAWQGDNNVSGFGLTNSQGALPVVISQICGGRLRICTNVGLAAPVRVAYQWDSSVAATAPVYDSNDAGYPDWGQPLLPHVPEMLASA